MNKTKLPPLLASFIRSCVSFFAFFALGNISRLIFNYNMFGMEDDLPIIPKIVGCIVFGLLLLLFHSVYFTFISKNRGEKQSFLERREKKGKQFSLFADVFCSLCFYTDLALLVIFSVALPLSLTYGSLSEWLFTSVSSNALAKVYTLLVALPLLVLLLIFAHVSARKEFLREENRGEKSSELVDTLKALAFVALAFVGASVIIPWFVPGIVTLWNLFGVWMLLWIPLIIIAIVGVVIVYSYIRAMLKCRKFVKALNKLCSTDDRRLSVMHKPSTAIFKFTDGIDFSVLTKKATYDCKIISGAFRNSPIVFSDKGNLLRQITFKVFGAELFHFMSKVDYDFESENKKVIVVLPMPRTIYASVMESPPRLADNGEKVGKYTVYSASGFLNMLDRE